MILTYDGVKTILSIRESSSKIYNKSINESLILEMAK